jgi:hypothetical protein
MAITANPPAENTDPWYAARSTFDTQVKATANGAETAAASATAAAATADGKAVTAQTAANSAQAKADAAVPVAAVAGLNTTGWVRGVWLSAAGLVPGGTPANTLVIRSAA